MDVRLITDDMNINSTAYKTVDHFQRRGSVKSLRALHAKIYIFDDHALVTSANLMRAAFFGRYESGVLLSDSDTKSVSDIYRDWWNNKAVDFSADFKPCVSMVRAKEVSKETSGTNLK
ncbi:MAG: phospholipase D-like domain-containing protein [Sedimentisphaerales bacterium]